MRAAQAPRHKPVYSLSQSKHGHDELCVKVDERAREDVRVEPVQQPAVAGDEVGSVLEACNAM